VYGLGANALDPAAVTRIFAAKGRPATNPLIVHVADLASARALSSEWPSVADLLAARFWPGPLTLVVNKAADVPDIVTAGGPTVGVRVPDHPVALDLLRQAGVPVAAPSANRSEEVSPTTAQHVADSLDPFVDDLLILDGGPTEVGIESTVLDVTTNPPRLLRPGMITQQALQSAVGEIVFGQAEGVLRSPGSMSRHYAPRAPVTINAINAVRTISLRQKIKNFITSLLPNLKKTAATPFGLIRIDSHMWSDHPIRVSVAGGKGIWIPMPPSPTEYAALLYAALRELDAAGVKRILIEEPPQGPEWAAIHDRLRRAAASKESQNNE
jgi:L-threonylcarbamoyladenylate synthase